jgi:O-antigen/teichoic acid export membrane protein
MFQPTRVGPGSWIREGGWWLAERWTSLIAAIAAQIIVIRVVGAAEYGQIAYALAVLALLLPLVQWGAAGLVGKSLLASPEQATRIIGAALFVRMAGAAVAVCLSCAYWIIESGGHPQPAVIVLALSQFALFLQVIEQPFQVLVPARPLAAARIFVTIFAALLKIIAAWRFESASAVLIVYALENLLQGAAHAWALRATSGTWPIPRNDSVWTRWLISRSPWLVAAGLAEAVYLKIDLLMLEKLADPAELGAYAAAARISEAWFIVPAVAVATGLPRLWRHRDSHVRWDAALQRGFDGLFAMAFVVALAVSSLAVPLVDLLLGEKMTGSAAILSIHVWGGVFAAMRALLSRWLLLEDLVRISLWTTVCGALTNVTLNLLLIPEFGGRGAAMATVTSYAVAGYLSLFLSRQTRPIALKMSKAMALPLRWHDLAVYLRLLRRLVRAR